MSQPTLKLLATAALTGGIALSLHAQMAQDPLLSRTASVEPNIVFMFDDSGSMPATAIYQYGGTPGGYGMSGPGDSVGTSAPTTFHGRSPDVNLIYYDPRTTYSRRINADGSFQAAGSTSSISSFRVYFYRPPTTLAYTVPSVTVNNKGSGYAANGVTASLSPPPAGGTQATATVTTAATQTVNSVTVTNVGSGYPNSGVTATFTAAPAGGVRATGTPVIGITQRVTAGATVIGGTGYAASGVTATFSAPANGTTATGTVTIGGTNKVSTVTVNNGGTGYALTGVTATFDAPSAGGVRATGTPNVQTTFRVASVTVSNQGNGYAAVPTVTFSAPGTPGGVTAVGNATVTGTAPNRKITAINITNNGSGYLSAPTITIGGGGSGGVFTPVMNTPINKITSVTITNPGSGYNSNPGITLGNTGGGTGATFTTARSATNWITGLNITNAGSGYAGAPTVTLGNTGGGTGATFNLTMGNTNSITGITITNPGSGYTSTPTVTLGSTGGGSGAAFAVNPGTTNVISSINITNAGSGYINTPVLTLGDAGGGGGATFTVNTSSYAVQPANRTWDGTGDPDDINGYFNPSYTPDSNSPLATGATVLPYPNQASASTTNYPKFRNRTDCGDSTVTSCTWAQELQNYANWKTYHSTRLELAKTGIGLAFQPLNPSFRLGWGTINTLADSSVLDMGVRKYNSTVQSDFLTWLYSRSAPGSTPNRKALDKVGKYYQRTDDGGPWADSPTGNTSTSTVGAENTGHAACRRSYAMLMTDGYYNDSFSLTDVDTIAGPLITQGGNFQYSPVGPYSDTINATQINNTFADVAMKYWVNDLRPNLNNSVKPVPGDEAYWQHLNFYAIGLGINGTLNATDPQVLQNLTGSATSTPPRSLNWPTPATDNPKAIDDMWHATVNGRGKLLNAKTASELNSSILQMMSEIGGKEGTQAGIAVSTASLTRDTKKYTPTYTPITWNGNVTAFTLDPITGSQTGIAWQVETLVATDPLTGVKSYSSIIPNAASRNIYVGNGATTGTRAVEFKYASMGTLTSSMNGTVNADLINFLRGDATNEDTSATTSSSTAIYRARSTRLGDIVNATPTFVKDSLDWAYDKLPGGTPGQSTYRAFVNGSGSPLAGGKKQRPEGMLFVGANDGMLHGFRDGTYDPVTGAVVNPGGIETFAYVPNALLPTINQLADKAYVHRYYVDGPNTETDAYFTGGTPRWANIVLGSTGAGAGAPSSPTASPRTAVYAIDVTSLNSGPTGLNASSVLWEVSSNQANFAELGYVLTDIQAGPTRDGSWVAIFGNGYESKSCQARLYVVNIQTGARIREINTNAGNCSTAKNGLSGVRLVRNASQQVIGVYAGDLLGNVWKFNLNNTDSNAWGVDLAGAPLFTAGATQPITAPPSFLTLSPTKTPAGGYMVVVGTGKFFEVSDITSSATQAIYGIWDRLAFGASTIPAGSAVTSKTALQEQTIGPAQVGANGNTYFALSQNPVDYTSATPKRGWYFDLPTTGQRNVYPIDIVLGKYGFADTISPANVSLDPCTNQAGGTGYLYIFNSLTGAGPSTAVLDTNGDGNFTNADLVVSGIQGSADGRNITIISGGPASGSSMSPGMGGTIDGNGAVGGDVTATSLGANSNLNTGFKCEVNCDKPPSKIVTREWRQLFLR